MKSIVTKYPNLFLLILTCAACLPAFNSIAQIRKHFAGDRTGETEFNKIPKSAQRATRDLENLPAAASIKSFTPTPGDQGMQGTCVAWSTGYAARTISYCIQHQITDAAAIQAAAFSPGYLYYYIKLPGDADCTQGAKVEPALKVLSDTGAILASAHIPDCMAVADRATQVAAKEYTIKAYSALTNTFGRISKNEVIAIKKSIAEKKPVIFSVKYFSSLDSVGNDGVWKIKPGEESDEMHAICIVGYDDNKLGGAFEVMNSWGTKWGNAGFFWITYDQIMQQGSYALEMMDRESYDAHSTRSLGKPQLKGSLDLVLTDDFGNDQSPMKVSLSKANSPAGGDSQLFFSNYAVTQSYAGGTQFKIKFTTTAPAFVYIFSIDDNKVISTLFPYATNVSPAINSTDATIYLPSEQKHYTLQGDAHRDRIAILYSKKAIDFDNLKRTISNSASTADQSILSLYKNRLIPVKNINFKDNTIGFASDAGESEIICFFIDMNHQ